MTAAELIAELSRLPGDTPIIVTGFDGWGYDDLEQVTEVAVRNCTSTSCVAPVYDNEGESFTEGEVITAYALT